MAVAKSGFLVGIICLLVVATATAHTLAPIETYGFGTSSCGRWTEARKTDSSDQALMTSWILGFVTAYNAFSTEAASGALVKSDAKGMFAWLDRYCADHPLELFINAAEHLLRDATTQTAPKN